jgi:Glycosyl hydrolase catalytic core
LEAAKDRTSYRNSRFYSDLLLTDRCYGGVKNFLRGAIVEARLDLWPHLMATGMRVGSPATAADPSLPGSWLEEFMDGAKARGYRVDFVCVHWYGEEFDINNAVNRLKNFLQAVHHKFQLPIWLTEYSLIRWTKPPSYPSWEQQAKFASKTIEMLETLPFVERYAWFSLPPWNKDGRDRTSLYYEDGGLTPAGVAYRKGPTRAPSKADAVGYRSGMRLGLVGDGFAAGSH